MRGLSLCIDIDGTITEAYDWIPRVNNYFKTNMTPENIKVYNIHEALGIQREAYDTFYKLYGEIIHEEARIRVGVKEVLDKLHEKHKVHLVSARDTKMNNITEKWLLNHELPLDTLSLLGTHDKVAKAQELSCDIFIEDSYKNAVQLATSGFTVLLMDCYYNQGDLQTGITRVMDWLEIKDFIECYEQGTDHYSKSAT